MPNRSALATIALLSTLLSTALGCAAEVEDDEEEEATGTTSEELRRGTNSAGCKRSPYNCKLNPSGEGQRVRRADGGESWAIEPAWLSAHGFTDAAGAPVVPVVDGNGNEMGRVKNLSFTLNYGQTRHMKGLTYVFALSTGLRSAGWVPIDAFLHAASLRDRVGEVNARGAGLDKMGCYVVASTYPARLDKFKVVKGATDADSQEPNDYLPVPRANGGRYMNLTFNVPGDALGGVAIDIFPAGTKFQRLDVSSWEHAGRPSIDATLYSKPAGSNHYTKPDGDMKFIYGYVKTGAGAVRYGWMAIDGLDSSTGCPSR